MNILKILNTENKSVDVEENVVAQDKENKLIFM